jgi:hypothetical protein
MKTTHEDKLVQLFGQLTSAMFQRGLNLSRLDDPHNYHAAEKLLSQYGNRLELRISMGVGKTDPFTTRGLIVDEDGEPLMQVFEIVADGGPLHA